MEELNVIFECTTVTVMLGVSLIIGLYYGCVEGKQNTVIDYLLGGKHMSVFPITISLITSHLSGISLLGVPSEIYSHGTQYLLAAFMPVISSLIVVYIYLPVFYGLQTTSPYEYLELRFNSKIRGIASLIFVVSQILFIPLVIFVPALMFNQVTGFDVRFTTQIICAICIFYTTIGGLKAVVMTDVIQGAFTITSLIIIIILGYVEVGGLGNVIKTNQNGGRIEFFRMDPDPFLRNTFWTICFGMPFQSIGLLGVHPSTVQRFVALPMLKKARYSLIYFAIGSLVVKILAGVIGMIIYTKYKDCDPYSANYIVSNKNLVPYFVIDVAAKYPGITGIFMSGIVSAALSTMSAHLNTVSGTIYEDFLVKVVGVNLSDLTASIIVKCTVVVVGVICVVFVVVVEKLPNIIQLSISLGSVTNGALLSVFTLGMCFPWANTRGAVCGMVASIGIMTWIVTGAQIAMYNHDIKLVEKNVTIAGCPSGSHFKNHTDYTGLYRMNEDVYVSPDVWKIYTISYMHYNFIGTFIGIVVGLAVSLIFPQKQDIDPKLLTPFIRKFMHPEIIKKLNDVKIEEYEPVSQSTKL